MLTRNLPAIVAACGLSLGVFGCDQGSTPKKSSAQPAKSTPVAVASASAQPVAASASAQPLAAPASYEAAGLSFKVADVLKKENIGGKAMPVIEFGLGDDQEGTFRVIVSEFPSGAGGPAEKGDIPGMMMMGRSTYLASAKPAESKVERTILGKKSSGDKSSGMIPRPTLSEAHVIERAPKHYVFLGFKYDKSFDAKRAESLIEGICSSLSVQK